MPWRRAPSGGGVDGAAHSAAMCVDAMEGTHGIEASSSGCAFATSGRVDRGLQDSCLIPQAARARLAP